MSLSGINLRPVLPVFLFLGIVQYLSAELITYHEDISAIVYDNCLTCHRPQGSGPFSLTDYASVSKRSRQIAEVTQSQFMPPWKPEAGYGPKLLGHRRLSEKEIELLQQWHENGAPEGDRSKAIPPPTFSEDWQLGTPDLVLSLDQAFQLSAEGNDVFRNLVIPIPVNQRRFIRALEFLPGNPKVVHHASLMIDRTTASLQQDLAAPGVGFDGMEISGAANPNGHFIGWTPGQRPYEAHEGTAWPIDINSFLVVQLHMIPSGKVESVTPSIGLYFSKEPPTRETLVLLLKSESIDIPAGEADYWIEERFTTPVDFSILRAYPHAHYLGKDLQVYSEGPNGEKKGIIRIPDWDFNWQGDYRFEEPMHIEANSTVVMRYRYDNSSDNVRNPFSPPRRVTYGWNSTDEMGEISLQVITHDRQSYQKLQSSYLSYKVQKEPNNPYTLNTLGYSLSQQSQYDKAKEHYLKALSIKPDLAVALNNLGALYLRQEQYPSSRPYFERAITALPDYTEAYHNLGNSYLLEKNAKAAIPHFKTALNQRPELNPSRLALAKSHVALRDFHAAIPHLEQLQKARFSEREVLPLLGGAYLLTGQIDPARMIYQAILKLDPQSRDALFGLGLISRQAKEYDAAYQWFDRVTQYYPDDPQARQMKQRLESLIAK